MIDFRPPVIEDKQWVDPLLRKSKKYGCEYSFGDVFIWQSVYDIRIAHHKGFFVSINGGDYPGYCCPVGEGDMAEVINDMIADADERGMKFRMFGLVPECVVQLDKLFPGRFEFEPVRDNFDYIYASEDLINLPGKKYHPKRNHISAFMRNNDWSYEPITRDNIAECIAMNAEWERRNREKDPDSIDEELVAITRSFENFFELDFVGGLLRVSGEVVAFTFGEEMNDELFCTHVEKAFADVRGAYPMINREFAARELSKYKYINREDDTGAEGLRRAKLSYYPAILLEKFIARLKKV